MNLRDLAEIAVLTAWLGQSRNTFSAAIPESFLKDFWRSSQLRCHIWHQDHIRYCKQMKLEHSVQLLEEVVVSEMLTRVMVSVMCHGQPDSHKYFGERVIEHELEIKRMILQNCYSDNEPIAERLRQERTQRRIERWTDLLASPFMYDDAVGQFANNKSRCQEFANQATYQNRITSPDVELSVFLSSVRLIIPNREIDDETRSSVQRNMANLSLSLIPNESCDEQGLRSRMQQVIARNSEVNQIPEYQNSSNRNC